MRCSVQAVIPRHWGRQSKEVEAAMVVGAGGEGRVALVVVRKGRVGVG